MIVAIWLTNKSKLEHEKAHIVQYMNLYMRILRYLERLEKTGDYMRYETKETCQAAIDRMAGVDFSEIKELEIMNYQPGSIHDKFTRRRSNEIIKDTNYFEMDKSTDPPFKVRDFAEKKTLGDKLTGSGDKKK